MIACIDWGARRRALRESRSARAGWWILGFVVALAGSAQSAVASDANVTSANCLPRSSADRSIRARSEKVGLSTDRSILKRRRLTIRVEPGDSLEGLFKAHRLSRGALYRMLTNREIAEALGKLRPRDQFEFEIVDNQLSRLVYRPAPSRYLEVVRAGTQYQSTWFSACPERRRKSASVLITSSLYDDGRAAGLSSQLVLRLADIFAPVTDLSRGLHPGDQMAIVYDQIVRDGERVADGAVLAAELRAEGRLLRLFQYVNGGRVDYYRADGTPALGSGFTQPVRGAEVSSGFTEARRHPVLGRVRAHKGLDFGARVGTPVVATADGRLAFKGRQRGYGRTLIVNHGARHGTLYAHLSRFSSGLRKGIEIRKGDTIGYVGRSGLASGSNLHYEVRVDGVPVDPNLHAHEPVSRLAGAALREFRGRVRTLSERLDAMAPSAPNRVSRGLFKRPS